MTRLIRVSASSPTLRREDGRLESLYHVRLAREDEAEECRELCAQFFPGAQLPGPTSVWWVAVERAHSLRTRDGIGFVDLREDLVGFASARILDDGSALLNSAGVLYEHRGHGLQKRLIRARLAWARREGCAAAVTYTMASNAASANSLIACGFRQYVPAAPWFGEAGDVCYWVRVLRGEARRA